MSLRLKLLLQCGLRWKSVRMQRRASQAFNCFNASCSADWAPIEEWAHCLGNPGGFVSPETNSELNTEPNDIRIGVNTDGSNNGTHLYKYVLSMRATIQFE